MELEVLNLSAIEEKLLIKLISYNNLTVKKLVELVGHDKKVVYENIRKLLRKGLVSETIVLNIRHYNFAGTQSITSIIDDKKENLEKEESDLKLLIKEIKKTKPRDINEQKNFLLYGKSGVRTLLNELLNHKEYLVIGATKKSSQIMGETFWHNFHRKQEEKKIKAKMIFNESLRDWEINNIRLKVKYLDRVEPTTEILIFGHTVGMIVWTQEPTTTIISNEIVANSYRDFFQFLWKQAKK